MRLLLATGLVGFALACSTPMKQLRAELDPRAADELHCPKEQLTYVELNKFISTTKVRISGCGTKRTYELVESAWRHTQDDSADFDTSNGIK